MAKTIQHKLCPKCDTIKCRSEFAPSYSKYGCGLCSYCRVCMKVVKAESKKRNRHKYRDVNRAINRRWLANNIEKNREKCRERYKRNKAEYIERSMKYKRMLAMAKPEWLTDEQKKEIATIYLNSSKDIHVDHIVPLNGVNVCGLHVPWNLQLLSAHDNISKNNRIAVWQ